jgi:mannose-6-phosphate isomerase
MEIRAPFHRNLLKYDSFVISMCIEGDCKIQLRNSDTAILLREGHSTLAPAAIADYDVIPLHAKTRILDAYIDNMDRSLGSQITRFLHITSK